MQTASATTVSTPPTRAFPNTYPFWGISRIQDNSLSFETVAGELRPVVPMRPKAIHDEMGEASTSTDG